MSLAPKQSLNVIRIPLDKFKSIIPATPFYFDFGAAAVLYAPEIDFFCEIPDAPLTSLGGQVDGNVILASLKTANDPLPFPVEESLL